MSYKKILWPTDGSKPALNALQMALELAKTFQSELYAMQVVPSVPMLSQNGFTPQAPLAFDVPLYEKELEQNTKESLEKTIAEHVPKKITVKSAVELGEPADGIVDFARREKVELIVMATHGRKGFDHFLLGSVAEKVIRNSPVPVLTVPMVTKGSLATV